ncbi:MAG: hypothetical protein Q9165_000712 [Trypethelium subeluteriae]
MDMIGRFLIEGFLLELLWEFCNTVFTDHVAEEPLKRGQPLTNDSSDPNGSLLQGLTAKKEVPREFAFWELDLIATRFVDRRKTLFTELESRRPIPGSGTSATWTHIRSVCLSEIQRIDKRIQAILDPPKKLTPEEQQRAIQSLPKLGVDPLKTDNILASDPPPTDRISKTVNRLDQFARSHGQSPGARDPVSPRAQQLLTYSASRALTPSQQAQLHPDSLQAQAHSLTLRLLRPPLGSPFRSTFARRATAVIAGAPYAHTGAILHATSALSHLVHHALREDTFGLVAKDVPLIVRALTATITAVDRFIAGFEVHWTDVGFEEGMRGRVEEVERIRTGLKEGLERVLVAYGEFLEMEGMSRGEINRAKECVGRA